MMRPGWRESNMCHGLRSLVLTGVLGMLLPLFVILSLFSALFLVGLIPFLRSYTMVGTAQLVHILEIFGNGSLIQGSLVIGLASSVVSALFDACNLLVLSKPIR